MVSPLALAPRRTGSGRSRATTTVAVVMPLLLLLLECLSLTTTCNASTTVGSRARVAKAAAAAVVASAGKDNVGGGGLSLNTASGLLHQAAHAAGGGVPMPPSMMKHKGKKKARVPYFVGHLFDSNNYLPQDHESSSMSQGRQQLSLNLDRTATEGQQAELFASSALTAQETGSSSTGSSSLAQTTLSASLKDSLEKTTEAEAPNQVVACHRPTVAIENSECDYDAVEKVNQDLTRQLKQIVSQKFFKYYKLNLYGTCPFWTENHYCSNVDCSVATMDEKHIPEEWRSKALGAISPPQNGMLFQPFKSCNLKDQDFCQVDDEANGEGVYVDLMKNPERFTGYSGPSAAKVWGAIYNENCFNVAHKMQLAAGCEQCQSDREAAAAAAAAAEAMSSATSRPPSAALNSMASVFGKAGGAGSPPGVASWENNHFHSGSAGQDDEDVCLEKRVFYRMISGLHASISIHICDEYFNQTTGVWGPNLECFVNRVGAHPDRMENLFFDYSMLLRAVSKMSRYLKDYSFCTGNNEEDLRVKGMVDKFIETAKRAPASFDEKAMFVGPAAQQLKTEFRDHYRNITRIMDCIGCEKCRLWGKVQTSGLATALKVLFSYNDEFFISSSPLNHPDLLQRTEIVALFNTLNRFSESIESISRFRKLYLEEYGYPEPAYWTHTPSPASSTDIELEQDFGETRDQDSVVATPEENNSVSEENFQQVMEDTNDKVEAPNAAGGQVEHLEIPKLVTEAEIENLDQTLSDNESQHTRVGVEQGGGEGASLDMDSVQTKVDDDATANEKVSGFIAHFLQQVAKPVDTLEQETHAVKQNEQRQQSSIPHDKEDKTPSSSVMSTIVVALREKVVLRFYNTRLWLASVFANRYNSDE